MGAEGAQEVELPGEGDDGVGLGVEGEQGDGGKAIEVADGIDRGDFGGIVIDGPGAAGTAAVEGVEVAGGSEGVV